jgi:hypothetical protein
MNSLMPLLTVSLMAGSPRQRISHVLDQGGGTEPPRGVDLPIPEDATRRRGEHEPHSCRSGWRVSVQPIKALNPNQPRGVAQTNRFVGK